jgi:hypothetical protein
MPLTLEEKKELLVDHIDPDFLVEVLNIGTAELADVFEDKILDNWTLFEYLEGDLISDYQQAEET